VDAELIGRVSRELVPLVLAAKGELDELDGEDERHAQAVGQLAGHESVARSGHPAVGL